MQPLRFLMRLWRALSAASAAGIRAWNVAGTIDSRLRRQQLRLALLDGDELQRLHNVRTGEARDPYREELHRRGLLH